MIPPAEVEQTGVAAFLLIAWLSLCGCGGTAIFLVDCVAYAVGKDETIPVGTMVLGVLCFGVAQALVVLSREQDGTDAVEEPTMAGSIGCFELNETDVWTAEECAAQINAALRERQIAADDVISITPILDTTTWRVFFWRATSPR